MSDIPQDVIDRMTVKCGRRCCICKRFRPTKLQVHHIQEKAQGGGNDEDNLIVTCFSCHSDVHTSVPFARRFSRDELKQHRDTLIKQVAEGVFPASDVDDADVVIRQVLEELRRAGTQQPQLTAYATEALLRAVDAPAVMQGHIMYVRHTGGVVIQINSKNVIADPTDNRLVSAYKNGLEQLVRHGLVERLSDSIYKVTYPGYLLAYELKSRGVHALTD